MSSVLRLGVIKGEGIGESVIDAAVQTLGALGSRFDVEVELVYGPDLLATGVNFSAVSDFYDSCASESMPILHGPAGGRFVYELRKWSDLFVKLTPVKPNALLQDASLLRPELLTGVDILLVRDNIGGLYQGDYGFDGKVAFQNAAYDLANVERLMKVASEQAMSRRGDLCVVLKPGGVPAISELWRMAAESVVSASVNLSFLEVDNACYQLGASPSQFDVMVSPNMFGDVLGDTASIALGSRGLSYSANFSESGFAVYQTAHGAARDLAGKNIANPLAQLYALGWLLETSLHRADMQASLLAAIDSVIGGGYRTADIASANSKVVSTSELTSRVVEAIANG
ncbi:MAG: isocitrate/isopropylmalate family dehydrogenase [Micrococcales bacterium]